MHVRRIHGSGLNGTTERATLLKRMAQHRTIKLIASALAFVPATIYLCGPYGVLPRSVVWTASSYFNAPALCLSMMLEPSLHAGRELALIILLVALLAWGFVIA